ncbi:MAG: hypothetical protein QM763_02735 [Agriterribacter sp.]
MNQPNSLYKIASLVAAVSFFIPLILAAIRNLLGNKLLLWFSVYWCWSGLINVLCSLECLHQSLVLDMIERLYNLVDLPLILFIILKTTQVDSIKRSLQKILLPLLILEIAVSLITWLENGMETAIVLSGVLLVLFYITWIILSYSKKISFKDASISYQYIYYALLFEYSTSILIVVYSYIIPDKANNNDNFLIFHISTIIAIATASAGILTYQEEYKPAVKIRKKKFQAEAEIRYL